MPATITRNVVAPALDLSNVSYVKNLMTAIGLPTSAIVYETTTEAIYKITRGTGTYADTYIRFYIGNDPFFTGTSTWVYAPATGFSSNAVTGTNAVGGLIRNHPNFLPTYFTYITSADNTYRAFLYFNASFTFQSSFHIVQPTNTSLTANACPLTYFYSSNVISSAPSASNPTSATNVRSQDLAQYGAAPGAYGLGTQTSGFAMNANKSGSVGVAPNLPILSNGWPIGYNTNLGITNNTLLPMDRVIVTAGSEEWMVCDRLNGVCVREVG